MKNLGNFIPEQSLPFSQFKLNPKKYCDFLIENEKEILSFNHRTYGNFILITKSLFLERFPQALGKLPTTMRLRNFRERMGDYLKDLSNTEKDLYQSKNFLVFSRKHEMSKECYIDFVLLNQTRYEQLLSLKKNNKNIYLKA